MVIKPTILTKAKDRQSSTKQTDVMPTNTDDISLEKSNVPIKMGKSQSKLNEHSNKSNIITPDINDLNSKGIPNNGKIVIEMRNCTVKGFDFIYSNSNIIKTKEIEFNCIDTAFLNSKTGFIIDNPSASLTKLFFRECLFHQNFICFMTKTCNFKIDIEKSLFTQNELCFKMTNLRYNKKTPHLQLLHLRQNSFEYNSKIMIIKNIPNEILIEENMIKYVFDKGFLIQNCRAVKFISNNCMKNHVSELYKKEDNSKNSKKIKAPSLSSFECGNYLY